MINPTTISAAQRPPLHAVDLQRACVYCETTVAPLVADGPNAFCCADTRACELRIQRTQPSIAARLPIFEGPIQLGAGVRFPLAAAQGRYLVFG